MSAVDLSEQERLVQDTTRKLAQELFKPRAAEADRTLTPPLANIETMAQNGFTGAFIPEGYGGAGLSLFESMLMLEEVARACANTAMLMSMSDGATPRAILHLGTPEQKTRYLAGFVSGHLRAAWSMSEPDAGSDIGALKTKAVRRDGRYVIDGSKMWCSCAQVADLFLVLVRLDDAPGMRGVGAILVERGAQGFFIGDHLDLIGLRATGMAPLYFDACEVPEENLLVPSGGMARLLKVFDADRIIGNPTICIGVAAAAIADITVFLKDRKQFGRALADMQGLQWKLADMVIDLEAARALVYRAARHADQGLLTQSEASISKAYANEMAVRVTNSAMQLAGAYGLSAEYPFERYFRDVRGMAIGYGTTEIHRNIIARDILDSRHLV